MNKKWIFVSAVIVCILSGAGFFAWKILSPVANRGNGLADGAVISLPAVKEKGGMALTEALKNRRSVRSYRTHPLTLADLGQLLWAAQGITEPNEGKRTAPSAYGTYPLEVFVVVKNVNGLHPGLYRYNPAKHGLILIREGDLAMELLSAVRQPSVKDAPVCLVIAGRTKAFKDMDSRLSERYAALEAGHAAQNVALQGTALNLGTLTIAGFSEEQITSFTGLNSEWTVFYAMPAGETPR